MVLATGRVHARFARNHSTSDRAGLRIHLMKTRLVESTVISAPTEAAIRDYAYHLYEQSGCVPGRDLDNWLEASAALHAHQTPPSGHVQPGAEPAFGVPSQGHVHAATGHVRSVQEATAHTNSHRHS